MGHPRHPQNKTDKIHKKNSQNVGPTLLSSNTLLPMCGHVQRHMPALSNEVDASGPDMKHLNSTTTTNHMEQQQRKQLQDRLGFDQHLLQCVLHQLPLHPRQWNMVTATCSELRDAVDGGRKGLRREIRNEHEETVWRDQG